MTEDKQNKEEQSQRVSSLLVDLKKNLDTVLEPPDPSHTGYRILLLDGCITFDGFSFKDDMILNTIKQFMEDV